jgi:EAL domain-containing protein (putative c-di-GMP-specific phosphodiesterase class I)
VRTLKNIGCKFSLDDFGTGLASHKYLKELPVDYVKIDGTFITDIHNAPTTRWPSRSTIWRTFLGQKTVAECVESLDIVPALREIGIDYLQGWGIGMPRELHEITTSSITSRPEQDTSPGHAPPLGPAVDVDQRKRRGALLVFRSPTWGRCTASA